MGRVYHILNHPRPVPTGDERRLWVYPGEWISLGGQCRLAYYIDHYLFRMRYQPRLALMAGDQMVEMNPTHHDWMDAADWTGLHIVPIAVEHVTPGRPSRMRVQFVRVRSDLRWAG